MKKEIVKEENKELAIIDFENDANKGMEEVDAQSQAIPFLTVLQGLSPQLETVEGAKPGMLINTLTNEIFKEVDIIPCAFQRRFVRWTPRDHGGGFKGIYMPHEIEVDALRVEGVVRNGIDYAIEGDVLKDTRLHYVLMQSKSGAWQPALISLSSTQIKKSKRLMSLIKGIKCTNSHGAFYMPPSFSHIYTAITSKEENSKGAWWGIDFRLKSKVSDHGIYYLAKEFYEAINSGNAKVDMQQSDDANKQDEDVMF